MSRVVVTGGLGFIGSALTRDLAPDHDVLIADAHTYAADRLRLERCSDRVGVERVDVASKAFAEFVERVRPDVIAHLAAETHVTRSEKAPALFRRTNIDGTRNVILAARRTGALLLHVSTDEVYGPIRSGSFSEEDKSPDGSAATSAYAKTKAVGDDLAVEAMTEQRIIVARPTNCYGPWQHPEKAVARWVTRALKGQSLPVWGDGAQVRDWMFVEDASSALITLIFSGTTGVFNVAPEDPEVTNVDLARKIATEVSGEPSAVFLTDYDRPDHDRRYRITADRLRRLGWTPKHALEDGIAHTAEWYRRHLDWANRYIERAEELYDDSTPAL